MLTPEIKTNLILKEIGIKRYSIRSKTTESPQKNLYCYQKGHILALLDKPFENFIEGDCNRLARSAGFAVAEKPGGTGHGMRQLRECGSG